MIHARAYIYEQYPTVPAREYVKASNMLLERTAARVRSLAAAHWRR